VDKITIEGTVPDTFTNQKEFYLTIAEKDIDRASRFIEQTDTIFRSGSIAVRKQSIVRNCRSGDYIELTIETQIRKDGIRLITTGFKKIRPA